MATINEQRQKTLFDLATFFNILRVLRTQECEALQFEKHENRLTVAQAAIMHISRAFRKLGP